MKNTFTGKLVRLRAFEPEDLALFEAEDKKPRHGEGSLRLHDPAPARGLEAAEDFPSASGARAEMENLPFHDRGPGGQHRRLHQRARRGRAHGHVQLWPGIYEPYRRRGYAREAILLLLRFYFLELRMHKCNTAAYSFNEASIGLHRSLGFVEEGRLREVVYTKGRYFDDVCFGMTREEFLEKYSEFAQEG